MSGYGAIAGMALSFLGGMRQKHDEAVALHEANLANKAIYEDNKGIVAELIGTLSERTSRADYEINRAALRRKREIIKASYAAEGDLTVRAAKLGTGAGRRASLATFRPTARVAGDMITDANIDLQTELTNNTEKFNEIATNMIQQLNNSIPTMVNKEGNVWTDILGNLTTALGASSGVGESIPTTSASRSNFDDFKDYDYAGDYNYPQE